MRRPTRSLGPVMVAERRGPHGRKRGKKLAMRQLRERARSHRVLQGQAVEGLIGKTKEWDRLRIWTAPIHPDGRIIR